MGDVTELRTGIRLSISQIASELGMSRNTVARRIEDRGIRADGRRGGYPVYRLRDLGPIMFGAAVSPEDESGRPDPNRMAPQDRRAHYQAENEKLKFEQDCGQLILASEVHGQMAQIAKIVTRFLATLPDVFERDTRCPTSYTEHLDKLVRKIREEIAALLAEHEDDTDEADVRGSA